MNYVKKNNKNKTTTLKELGGAGEACRAHNAKVVGSKPTAAI